MGSGWFGLSNGYITTATLYAALGPNAFQYICEETKIKTILVSPDLVKMLCDLKINLI
jgi:hypothetical protein